MNTYSHFLITAGLDQVARNRTGWPLKTRAFLLGAVLPDVPLVVLTLGYFVHTRFIRPELANEFIFGPRYDALYFTDPVWITGHSLFHAPPLILALALLGFWAWRRGRGWGLGLLWFAAGCGLHSLVDILTHHHDGPLLLFPFDWSLRFQSPVSYWDGDYHAGIVAPLEHLLDVTMLVYLGREWWRRRARAGGAP